MIYFQKAKGDSSKMEDTWVATQDYLAVFDGATPKTAFRFSNGQTPGQVAANTLAEAVKQLPARADARTAIQQLTESLHQALDGHTGEASGVIYSLHRQEIWRVGDCPFALIDDKGKLQEFRAEKRIDALLSDWRASIVKSYLSRGLMSESEIMSNDPGRKIIQPFITRQTIYQNKTSLRSSGNDHSQLYTLNSTHSTLNSQLSPKDLFFGVFDGNPIPDCFIEVYSIGPEVKEIILATDGYPQLCSTLKETEIVLQRLLQDDPLCIGALKGTKCIQSGNNSFDDRTYVKIQLEF